MVEAVKREAKKVVEDCKVQQQQGYWQVVEVVKRQAKRVVEDHTDNAVGGIVLKLETGN